MAALTLSPSSCALLRPSASIEIYEVTDDYRIDPYDTTKTVFDFDSNINIDFDISGSDRISVRQGLSSLLADGISPGWFYIDVIGANLWVRGLPVYLIGGDTVTIDVDSYHLDIDGRPFFAARQEKSTEFSFVPVLSMSCAGCTRQPTLRFDGQQVEFVPPWISLDAGWHTIEIYSPFDHVNLYYRTLFDSFTVTEFTLYPVLMN